MQNPAMPMPHAVDVDPLGTTSVNERVNAILSLTHQLSSLITSETSLLKSRRAAALRETEAEKSRLSALYAREMRAIQMRPELLAGATGKQTEMLRAASVAFRACVVTHVRTLARIRSVSEGLIVAIGEELGRLRKPMTSYRGPSMTMIKSISAVPQTPVFGFDRSI
ncbi:MAG: hypothetical protein ABL951_10445 [Alphaproteobacteria bacterium]